MFAKKVQMCETGRTSKKARSPKYQNLLPNNNDAQSTTKYGFLLRPLLRPNAQIVALGGPFFFVHPLVQCSAPSGEWSHGYATAPNDLTCQFVHGVNKHSLEFPALVHSIIKGCQMATCLTLISAIPRYRLMPILPMFSLSSMPTSTCGHLSTPRATVVGLDCPVSCVFLWGGRIHWGIVLSSKIMILQGVRHPISCLGVCFPNNPQKGGGCMVSAYANNLSSR